jgi:hypothetical protein
MSDDNVTRYALKPLSVGLVAGAAFTTLEYGSQVRVFGDTLVPLPVFVAGMGALASLGSELINSYVFEHIPSISALSHPMHTGLTIGAQVGMICAAENAIAPGLVGDLGLTKIAAVAAVAEVGGNYLAKEWLSPWYNQMVGADSH